ncbi:MAG: phosphatidylserine decarboxylase [Gammaproteobacteria bacterium]|nr:MAG: phosphatidylserine decarboxylase [Gammaproteobacteria bacterium]
MRPGNWPAATGRSAPSSKADPDRPVSASLLDRLITAIQYLIPQHGYCALVHWIAHCRTPWFKTALIHAFIRLQGVDMEEALEPDPAAYEDFNAFFTRALKLQARPVAGPGLLASPVDGTISQIGTIRRGSLLQAKGHDYRLAALLGDEALAERLEGGAFVTLYLSPRDYHRVHMPLAGTLEAMRYVPGSLFSVNERTTRTIPGLFTRNERLVMDFSGEVEPLVVVMVGAIGVGGLETVWAGEITPPHGTTGREWRYPGAGEGSVRLAKGAELGRFNLGSTVILALPAGTVEWDEGLTPGTPVRMGQPLGRLLHPAPPTDNQQPTTDN